VNSASSTSAIPSIEPEPGRSVGFPFDLPAEAITVRMRWFGVLAGFALINFISNDFFPNDPQRNVLLLNVILGIGVVYTLFDTYWSLQGRVFLSKSPLVVSLLEAMFIGLLCHFDLGEQSPFRIYYFLSLLVCAIRYRPVVAYSTLLLHAISFGVLLIVDRERSFLSWVILVVSLAWVTWASTRMAGLFRAASAQLSIVNAELEQRIVERTQQLKESQAMLVQQEKQAAFGLLAAGIAHEVGNPLAAISSLVQLLKRRTTDQYALDRYQMLDEQLRRIQGTLRELVDFSRPAAKIESTCNIHEVIEDALSIAKYYKRRKGKRIVMRYAENLPPIRIVRPQVAQVFLNLIQNAMDATREGGTIEISTCLERGWICIAIRDTGHGVTDDHRDRIFDPYFTTKDTGTGLGLFVCRHILERSGNGRIELTATSSEGSTFSVLLTSDEVRALADIPSPPTGVDHSLSVTDALLMEEGDSVAKC